MRTLVIAIAVVVVAGNLPAMADTAAGLVTRGEQLAKAGQLTEAIDAFKQADRIEARASHSCLIALAYIRRELWPQAEIFLAQCTAHTNSSDPLPDWVPLAAKQLEERMTKANVAAVAIQIKPAALAARAKVTVSSFAPDEQFEPRTIHLPLGKHLISAAVPGKPPITETIEITDTTPRELVLELDPRTEVVPKPRARKSPSRAVPWTLTALGGALALGGGAYHLLVFKPTRDKLVDATDATPDPALYDATSPTFDRQRTVTAAIYGAAAVSLIAGLVLRATVYRDRESSAPQISTQLVPSGAVVGLEWRR